LTCWNGCRRGSWDCTGRSACFPTFIAARRKSLAWFWASTAARRQVRALTYIVDRGHVQYAGRLSVAESLHYVRQGHGRSGQNRDYVIETVRALEALGYRESDLHLLADRLKGPHEAEFPAPSS
jgi:cation transport protein ChaC